MRKSMFENLPNQIYFKDWRRFYWKDFVESMYFRSYLQLPNYIMMNDIHCTYMAITTTLTIGFSGSGKLFCSTMKDAICVMQGCSPLGSPISSKGCLLAEMIIVSEGTINQFTQCTGMPHYKRPQLITNCTKIWTKSPLQCSKYPLLTNKSSTYN